MQHSKSLPLLALILPAACSAASDPADTGTSKSDLIGFPQPIPTFPGPIPTFEPPPPAPPSCSGRCGEMGGPPSNVFEPFSCLSGCEADGTCCGDYETACTPETGSCFGFCGGQAPDGCWCDDACTSFGDCCVDESAACDGWPRAFGNSTGSQNGTAAIADGDSLFVTGVFEGTVDFGGKSLTRYPGDTTQDGFVARYSQTGSLVWVYGIRGPQQQWPHDVAVDGQGFVYVAGHFWNTVDFGDGVPRTSHGNTDAFLLCLSPGGQFQWVKTFGGGGYDEIMNVVSGDRRWVYVAGSAPGTVDVGGHVLPSGSHFIAAYDWNGNHRWSRRFDPASGQTPALALEKTYGDLIVGDTFSGSFNAGDGPVTSAGSTDVLVARYDYAGTPVLSTFTVGGSGSERLHGLAVDDWGNVFLSGRFTGTLSVGSQSVVAGSGGNVFLASATAGGSGRWVRKLADPPLYSSYDEGNRDLALDPGGNVWLAAETNIAMSFGGASVSPSGWDAVLASYTNSGAFRSQSVASGTSSQFAYDATADRHGRGYLVGSSYGTLQVAGTAIANPTYSDIFVMRSR